MQWGYQDFFFTNDAFMVKVSSPQSCVTVYTCLTFTIAIALVMQGKLCWFCIYTDKFGQRTQRQNSRGNDQQELMERNDDLVQVDMLKLSDSNKSWSWSPFAIFRALWSRLGTMWYFDTSWGAQMLRSVYLVLKVLVALFKSILHRGCQEHGTFTIITLFRSYHAPHTVVRSNLHISEENVGVAEVISGTS